MKHRPKVVSYGLSVLTAAAALIGASGPRQGRIEVHTEAFFQSITTNFPLVSAVILALLAGKWIAAQIVPDEE